MNALILYSFRRCPFAIRVRMVLEEKGLSYRRIEEDLSNLSPELLSLHPEGRVPLLVHQLGERRQVIYQSNIITEYLDEAFSDLPLMPTDPMDRAQVRLWTYWCDYLFKPDLDLYKYELSKLSESEADNLRSRLHDHFSRWDNALQVGPFMLGPKLTLADIHIFPFARQFMSVKPALPSIGKYTRLNSWLAQMLARPAFEKVMAN